MISTRVLTALALAVLVIAAPAARAQYMYLDSNGNGVHDSGDQLAGNGSPTTVDLWLVTDHNRDGSVATCDVGPEPLSMNDYYFNLQAAGGSVTYSGFVTHVGNITFPVLNPGDGVRYANGQGGITTFPPGTYRLATITITGTSGTPAVSIVDRVTGSIQITDFGTGASGCFGNDFDNTYKLTGPAGGSDWTDADGLASAAASCLAATAYTTNGNKQVNLGKQGVCIQIQPANGSFTIGSVVLSSIVMRSSGTGSVSEIPADASKTTAGGDKNGDGIAEITACFKKEDLQQLFSGLSGTQSITVDLQGNVSGGGTFCASTTLTIKAGGGGGMVASISPNPLNPSAVLTFTTSRAGAVKVQLFDTQGRLIRTLVDQSSSAAGYHDVRIDGRDAGGDRLASGVYYLKIQSVDGALAKAVTILK